MTSELREAEPGFASELAKVAAAQWPWVAQSLHDSIANLGYPVGMGMSPNAASTERAAKMICDYVACQVDEALTRHPAPLSEENVARLNRRIFALRGLSSTAEARPFCDSDGDWGLIEFASDVRDLLIALSATQESNRE